MEFITGEGGVIDTWLRRVLPVSGRMCRRAAGRVYREDPHRRRAGKASEKFLLGEVGGRHNQVRL